MIFLDMFKVLGRKLRERKETFATDDFNKDELEKLNEDESFQESYNL